MVSRAQKPSGRHTCLCPSSRPVTQFQPSSHALQPSLPPRRFRAPSTNPLRFSVELRLSTHLVTGPGDTDSDADTETDLHLSPSPTEHRPKARLAHPGLDRTRFSPFQPLGTGVTSTSAPCGPPTAAHPSSNSVPDSGIPEATSVPGRH